MDFSVLIFISGQGAKDSGENVEPRQKSSAYPINSACSSSPLTFKQCHTSSLFKRHSLCDDKFQRLELCNVRSVRLKSQIGSFTAQIAALRFILTNRK